MRLIAATRRRDRLLSATNRLVWHVKIIVAATEFCRCDLSHKLKLVWICATYRSDKLNASDLSQQQCRRGDLSPRDLSHRVSRPWRFYQFVTIRYTTDFYIIKWFQDQGFIKAKKDQFGLEGLTYYLKLHRTVSMAAVYQLKIKYAQDNKSERFFRRIWHDKKAVSFPFKDKNVVNELHVIRKVMTPHRKNVPTWCISVYQVTGLKQTRGIKKVTLKAAKKFVSVAVY